MSPTTAVRDAIIPRSNAIAGTCCRQPIPSDRRTEVNNEHGIHSAESSAARPGRRCRKPPAARRNDFRRTALTQNRQVDANQKAELAAGIGQTEQDQESSERDADGRRLWEARDPKKSSRRSRPSSPSAARQSKDATGQSGTQLDLTG